VDRNLLVGLYAEDDGPAEIRWLDGAAMASQRNFDHAGVPKRLSDFYTHSILAFVRRKAKYRTMDGDRLATRRSKSGRNTKNKRCLVLWSA
jgi:hypothetical protein